MWLDPKQGHNDRRVHVQRIMLASKLSLDAEVVEEDRGPCVEYRPASCSLFNSIRAWQDPRQDHEVRHGHHEEPGAHKSFVLRMLEVVKEEGLWSVEKTLK